MKLFKCLNLITKSFRAVWPVILALLLFLITVPYITYADGDASANTGDASGATGDTQTTGPAPYFETEVLVGIIDVTVGHIEPASELDGYNSQFYTEGRIAFYLKGKIKGKYLLTAQLDTGEEPLGELLKGLDQKDPNQIFEKIDPERYYPVYGDQSTVLDDVQSQGKLYVRLEWDQSKILLGDYPVSFNQTEFANYNRNLYGLDFDFQSKTDAKKPSGTQIFWAKPLTVHAQDVLKATGGSLYYLKHADLVIGSEQVAVQVRHAISGEVISSTPLVDGRDYELDYAQGRVILKRQLSAIIESELITTNQPLDGNPVFLIADYDFENADLMANPSYGLRTNQYLGDSFRIGGSIVQENMTDSQIYRLYGVDFNYQMTPKIAFAGELAKSQLSLANCYYSDDGGLTYHTISQAGQPDGSYARKIGLNYTLPEFIGIKEFNLNTYLISKDGGFSSPGQETLHDTTKFELQSTGKIFDGYSSLFQFDSTNEVDTLNSKEVLFQLGKTNGKLKLTEEIRYQTIDDITRGLLYSDTLGAVRADYQLNDTLTIYGSEQLTLTHNDETPRNNRTILGADYLVNKYVTLNMTGSMGDLGNSLLFGADYNVTNTHQIYSKALYDSDQFHGHTYTAILGDRGKISEKADLYTEHQWAYGTYENSDSDLYGIDFYLTAGWVAYFNYTRSLVDPLLKRPENYYPGVTLPSSPDGPVDRRIFGIGAVYKEEKMTFKTGYQLKYDINETLSSVQYLTTNSLEGKWNDEYAYYCKLNYSRTFNQDDHSDLARFAEGTLGFAYRPVLLDRFNLLGEYSYLEELAPDDQDPLRPFFERSQIISLEWIYDFGVHWQWSEKYAYKHSQLQLDDNNWLTNDLTLWINRLNYHLPFRWDLSVEYRILKDIQAEDQKSGFLAALYYNFDLNNRLGIGYNFTDFNDDLAHLDYNAHGWFLNYMRLW
jgi:hypothetical protein